MFPLLKSAEKRLPAASKTNPCGPFNPDANVLRVPVGVNLKIVPPWKSATKRLPLASKASPCGLPTLEAKVLRVPVGVKRKILPLRKSASRSATGGIEDQIGRPVEPGRKCRFRAVWGKLVNDPAEEIRVEQISCRIKYQTGRAIQAGGKDAVGAVGREFIYPAGAGFRNKQVAVFVEGQSFGATQTGGVKGAAATGGEAINVATGEIGLKQIAGCGLEARKRKEIGQGGYKDEKSGERLLHIDNRVENRRTLLGYQVERVRSPPMQEMHFRSQPKRTDWQPALPRERREIDDFWLV